MTCAEIREQLPALADEREPALAVRRHLARCPACRAELALYGSLRSELASLSAVAAEPPKGLLASLVAVPRETSAVDGVRIHLARNRRAYVSGAAVAVAGAAVGVLVLRSRKTRLATG